MELVKRPGRNCYGKGDVIVYRLTRDGQMPAGASRCLAPGC